MLGKSRIAVFFQWFVVPDVRKVGSLQRQVWRLFRRETKNGTPLWREAHFQVKMYKTPQGTKTPQGGANFWSFDREKWHAAVARSAFATQNAQNTTFAEQFLKWRLEQIARGCGAKRICNSKCEKTGGSGHFLKLRCRKISQLES